MAEHKSMEDENGQRIVGFLDDDWEEAMLNLSDDEKIAYMDKIYDVMSKNLDAIPGLTMEMLDEVKNQAEVFERSVRRSKIADREEAIAKARMEASADAYLAASDKVDKSRGN